MGTSGYLGYVYDFLGSRAYAISRSSRQYSRLRDRVVSSYSLLHVRLSRYSARGVDVLTMCVGRIAIGRSVSDSGAIEEDYLLLRIRDYTSDYGDSTGFGGTSLVGRYNGSSTY